MDLHAGLQPINNLNAPTEVCETVKARFLEFLNDFAIENNVEPERSGQVSMDGECYLKLSSDLKMIKAILILPSPQPS